MPELSPEQRQTILNAIDLYNKTHGLRVAGECLIIAQIMQSGAPVPEDANGAAEEPVAATPS